MTKVYSTKRSLITSVIALMLCFSMLLGTTFAWFTDSVTSANNIIKSGNLDVEMYWADGTAAVPTVDAGWTDASSGPIFKNDLWEPGYVEVRHIKIANEGTLALKYQLAIAANGEVSKLADVIDVYYVDPATQVADRTQLPADKKLGTLTQVLANLATTASGNLEAGNAHTVTLALKMQESAGNEYQDLAIGTDFSVKLFATQLDAEEDSFGKDYDADLDASQNGIARVTSNGSTVMYYSEESGYAGKVRLTALPENLGSEYVVPAEVNDLGGVLAGKTLDKLTIHANVQNAYKSLQGTTVDTVVVESGMTTIPDRMFYRATVDSVVIPSTVKNVVDSAFQESIIKEIKVPASVEYFGVQAFGSSKIETVTFEGNTRIQNKAFRGCANLRTVYINGDDITFENTTGQANCWFCNSESNNPGTSDITFYVKNETVAAKVKAAMGAEVQSEATSKVKIYVNNVPYFVGTKL